MPQSFNQNEKLESLRKGNKEAMADFVRSELPKVYNLCLRLCRSSADADDLCQDVFIRAVKAVQQFRGQSSLSTWLHRITLNTWKNQIRYQKRRKQELHLPLADHANDDDHSTASIELIDSSPSPEDQFERKERKVQILKALDQLDPDHKAILILKDIQDHSYEEIADILELKIGTVKSKLSRARDELRQTFSQTEGIQL